MQEKEVTEDEVAALVEELASKDRAKSSGKAFDDMGLDELDELEDDEDEKVLAQYRARRIAEMKAAAAAGQHFGSVINITGAHVGAV